MSIYLNPGGEANTYVKHDTLATSLAAIAGAAAFAVWVKGYSTGDYFMSLGASGGNDAAFHISSSTPNIFIRARSGGSDISHTKDLTGTTSDWALYVLNFTPNTQSSRSIQYSINGQTLSSNLTGSAGLQLITQLTVGAGRFNGTSPFSHVNNMGFAYPAFWDDPLTQGQIGELYGSGPSAGDALAPWLVSTGTLVHASSWKDGTLTQGAGTVGTAWTLVGSATTAADSDNPTLIESLGQGGGAVIGGGASSVSSKPFMGGSAVTIR